MKNALRRIRGESQKNIVKLLDQLSGKYSAWEVWQDFITMSAISIANTLGGPYAQEREKTYRERIKKYTEKEQLVFPQMFAEMVAELDSKGKKLFYYIEEYSGEVRFYIEKEKKRAAPVRRSSEEIEREKRIADAWEKAEALNETTRSMRKEFVAGLCLTSKNREAMLAGAVRACIVKAIGYSSSDTKYIRQKMGLEADHSYSNDVEQCLSKLMQDFDNLVPAVIYGTFGDNDYSCNYIKGFKKDFPVHEDSKYLNAVYDWLISLGYVMSDTEKQLRDGTHEVFHLNDDQEEKAHV